MIIIQITVMAIAITNIIITILMMIIIWLAKKSKKLRIDARENLARPVGPKRLNVIYPISWFTYLHLTFRQFSLYPFTLCILISLFLRKIKRNTNLSITSDVANIISMGDLKSEPVAFFITSVFVIIQTWLDRVSGLTAI